MTDKIKQREIKFRAWDKKYKEMIEDIWIAPEYGWLLLSDNDAMCERERPEEGQCFLMQYTGLKDKNGKEIYEGDIVRYNDPMKSKEEYRKNPYTCLKVSWIKHKCCFVGCFQGEVIGNIYENPELLKEL